MEVIEIDKSIGFGEVFKSVMKSLLLYFVYILIFPLALIGLPIEFIRLGLDGSNRHIIEGSALFSLLVGLMSSAKVGLFIFILISFVSLSVVNLYKGGLSLKAVMYGSFFGLILFTGLSVLIYQYTSGTYILDELRTYYKSMVDNMLALAKLSDPSLVKLFNDSMNFMVENIYGLLGGIFYIGIGVNIFFGLNRKEDIKFYNFKADPKFTTVLLVALALSIILSYSFGGTYDLVYTNVMSFISLVFFTHLMTLILYLTRNMGLGWKVLAFFFGLMVIEIFPALLIVGIIDSYVDFRKRNNYGKNKA